MSTIKDVAQKSGVTVTTVSRVLNNKGSISEKTREKVYEAMKELDYHPNEIARSLFRKRSNIIGVIIPTIAHPFFSELVNYIEYYANEYKFKIMLCDSHLERDKEREYIGMLKRHQVDGIIMGSHTLEIDEYINVGLPIVTFDRCLSENIPSISSDNYEGGRLAADLLINKGCRKIAHICGNLNLNLLSNKRYEAFITETNKSNVEHIIYQTAINGFDFDEYENIMDKLFCKYPDIDGIFATSDVIAAYAVKACIKYNKKIPEDIKIVGYDDISMSSIITPQITTIKQPLNEMAKLSVELIIKQINNEEICMNNILPVTLVERSTT